MQNLKYIKFSYSSLGGECFIESPNSCGISECTTLNIEEVAVYIAIVQPSD